jgi:hypothetical protein
VKIDLHKYVVNRDYIQRYYRKNKEIHDMGYAISLCAATTGCPCIALAFYLGEDIGYVPELLYIIDRLIKSGGYTGVIGMPESYLLAIKE